MVFSAKPSSARRATGSAIAANTKSARYKGIICDKCGVEVTRADVRRERMGHIMLAAPVAHIWYTRRVPSYLGLLLDISRRNLDRVLYFAQYIVTYVDEEARQKALKRLEDEISVSEREQRITANAKIAEIKTAARSQTGRTTNHAKNSNALRRTHRRPVRPGHSRRAAPGTPLQEQIGQVAGKTIAFEASERSLSRQASK
jgi:DNA-directed RNA polymerase subunit beta'